MFICLKNCTRNLLDGIEAKYNLLSSNYNQDNTLNVRVHSVEKPAEDFEATELGYVVTTPPELLYEVKEKLTAHKIPIEESSLEMIPKNYVECSEEIIKANEGDITRNTHPSIF